jgi:hypothetical protein
LIQIEPGNSRAALDIQWIFICDNAVKAQCSMCGRAADPVADGDPPRTWCADIHQGLDGPYTRWVCPACTRQYVRSIEAKLDSPWW